MPFKLQSQSKTYRANWFSKQPAVRANLEGRTFFWKLLRRATIHKNSVKNCRSLHNGQWLKVLSWIEVKIHRSQLLSKNSIILNQWRIARLESSPAQIKPTVLLPHLHLQAYARFNIQNGTEMQKERIKVIALWWAAPTKAHPKRLPGRRRAKKY